MHWKAAVYASPAKAATRLLTDGTDQEGTEPNIVLLDGNHRPACPKAFRAVEACAWKRRSLRTVRAYEDWEPAQHRGVPMLP